MLAGTKLQSALWLVVTRWRLFAFVFTADVVQMFRQIGVHIEDQNLQRILWRVDPSLPIREYCLTTVMYGTTAAPYMAIRTMLQLASDEEKTYPHGAIAVRDNTYVDDILYGGHTLAEAARNRQQLIDLLRSGGFFLAKWTANHKDLCPNSSLTQHLFTDASDVSTLGLLWSAHADEFHLRVVPLCHTSHSTKRTVLSDIARFFDPLGWAAPVLIYGRIFLQELWQIKLSWDEHLPEEFQARWAAFASDLSGLSAISVPRSVKYSPENCNASLHGFSDAFERAYGAAVYIRCEMSSNVFVFLLAAKTKVAPLSTVSIPRLELCGAVLVAQLMKATASGLPFKVYSWHFWTDARVVLCWLQSHPSRWVPYVAHRVAKVQEIAPYKHWHHVSTDANLLTSVRGESAQTNFFTPHCGGRDRGGYARLRLRGRIRIATRTRTCSANLT